MTDPILSEPTLDPAGKPDQKNKEEKTTCACGSTFFVKNRAIHEKTKKHLQFTGQDLPQKKRGRPPKDEDFLSILKEIHGGGMAENDGAEIKVFKKVNLPRKPASKVASRKKGLENPYQADSESESESEHDEDELEPEFNPDDYPKNIEGVHSLLCEVVKRLETVEMMLLGE